MSKFSHSLSAKLNRWAQRLENQDAREARRLGIGLPLYRCINRVRARCNIDVVLDVGANTGGWAAIMANCLPTAQIHCFEPLPACQEALLQLSEKNPRVHVHSIALGAERGHMTMNANQFSPSSSLLPMTARHTELWPATGHVEPIEVPIHRLDDEAGTIGGNIFLKLDVQGYEMPVLQGARNTLTRTSLIVTEVLFERLYENQTGIAELIAYLDEQGFQLAEVLYQHRGAAADFIAYADLAFVSRTILK